MSHKPTEKKRGYCISSRGAERVFAAGARWVSAQQCAQSLGEATTLGCVAAGEPPFVLFCLRCASEETSLWRDSPLAGCVFAFLRVYSLLSRVTHYVVFLSTAVIKGDMILKRELCDGALSLSHCHVMCEKPLWAIKPADMIFTDRKAVVDGALLPNGEWMKCTHVVVLSSWWDGLTCWTVIVLDIFVLLPWGSTWLLIGWVNGQMDDGDVIKAASTRDQRSSGTETRPRATPCPGLQFQIHWHTNMPQRTCGTCVAMATSVKFMQLFSYIFICHLQRHRFVMCIKFHQHDSHIDVSLGEERWVRKYSLQHAFFFKIVIGRISRTGNNVIMRP